MKRAMEVANWRDFPKRAKLAKKQGLVRGIGMGSYVEVCGSMGMDETANVRLDPSGDVTILIGTQSSGQGHATAYAQIIADQFGLSPERVHMHQGDTDEIASGLGTGGSSSIPSGGVCVERATRELGKQLKTLAAEALETSAGDLEINGGMVRIAGTDRSISFADLAKRAGDSAKLSASASFNSADGTYPNGTHVAEVEIDPATGIIKIVNYVIVDDFGVTLNPLLLAGQVHGGVMQGIGQALMEQVVYSPTDGQLVTGTYMDYALPRASDGPSFHFETHNVPCKTNPLGVKGAGEAGAIGSCPAVVNAIVEGLWREYKIDHIDMPATAERVWIAIREHQRRHSL
jgi:aerobic carbon-monoxide dehydrogenase large subunit